MAQIRQLQRARPEFRKRKLCPRKFVEYQMNSLTDLHNGYYKRATFYFANGDEVNVSEYILTPEFHDPGVVRDINFKFCGHKLKKSAEFDKFVEESVPQKFQTRFSKSEKGIDIEMCCDALRLAITAKMERLFLLTNDGDFIPFCRTIKEFGANISIIHLSGSNPPNKDLLREADSYDVVRHDDLNDIFGPVLESASIDGATQTEQVGLGTTELEAPVSEKPNAAPSDLSTLDLSKPD